MQAQVLSFESSDSHKQTDSQSVINPKKDPHSFSNPEEVRVRHLDLVLYVSFEDTSLHGFADLAVEWCENDARELILDTMGLRIVKVEYLDNGRYYPATFRIGEAHPVLGAPLTVDLPCRTDRVRVEYLTDRTALGLQWLEPRPARQQQPFLLTQSQTIYARSWVPLQDSPQVRITYRATIHCPENLLAVMGAANNPTALASGEYKFEMPQPIPSYLMALAIGDLVFKPVSRRSGVYADKSLVDMAAAEFADIDAFITKTEQLYGPYRWDRYDLLVLPSSFPLGGMENPRLTFVTPTILVGDKSLVSLIVHELAHSWAGNLVTNATWSDFWLNEGISVYVERRIVEEIYGRKAAQLEASFGRKNLDDEIARLTASRQVLHANCEDPEDCVTEIPYEKGALFLAELEKEFGRTRFDEFLRQYFDHFAFQSIGTEDFVDYLTSRLLNQNGGSANPVPIAQWLYEPGIPASASEQISQAAIAVRAAARLWLDGSKRVADLGASSWTAYEWLYFLKSLPPDLPEQKLRELDRQFHLTASPNSEIVNQWLLMAIRANYESAGSRLEQFLVSVGREKLIKPLYEELAKSDTGMRRAKEIYRQARSGYHPLVVKKIDRILSWED
jgi:leukotriene-A4 hydrolase